jgi:hypothetical protein
MAGPIYKCFRLKWKEAWYQLSKSEQEALLAKVTAALEQAGGRSTLLCNSDWSNEQWMGFGIEEFPSIEAVQQHTARLNELNWFRYIESEHLLGAKWEE